MTERVAGFGGEVHHHARTGERGDHDDADQPVDSDKDGLTDAEENEIVTLAPGDVLFREGDDAEAEATIYVGGMYCAACSWLIETSMTRVAVIESADINPVTHRLRVKWLRDKVGLGGILSTLANLGYGASEAAQAVATAAEGADAGDTARLIRAALKRLAPKG